ncbi:Outer membrane receptor proteins, mostly Fe transport [Duganella sacchari]|uniref:Outer membrane receptor proteins, mostly Fe transport n=1 Tax=Duganella sacchari TaxID=551987 RepID=A0A1M7K7B9_9BURK|nr:TonB-dependent receptor [Duganella sacchari]SHM61199.1 Outer membrane receptor proteins, mostly Fe transport [Duganella sacchari]
MRPPSIRILPAAISLICGGLSWCQAQAQDGPVEQVLVTAQKRSEALQSVPLSVTALDWRELEHMGVEHLSDIARQAPGLTVVSSGPGQNILIVRGISSVAGTAGTVGYYLDDTPIAASSNASLLSLRGLIDPAIFDIARVEVLRGPQGTLYGSSSMGGTVKYVSTQPDLNQRSGKASVVLSHTQDGGWNKEGNASINVPLSDSVAALRIGVYYRDQDGYIDRYPVAANNILAIAPGGARTSNVNTEQTKGARIALRVNLGDGLVATASLYYQHMLLGAPFQIDVPPGSLERLIQTRLVAEPSVQNSSLSNLTLRKSFERYELVSSTSYYDRRVSVDEDASKVLYYFFSPKPQTSVYPGRMHGDYINREFTQEVRMVSDFSGPLQMIAGAYYHHVDAPLASSIPVPDGYNNQFGTSYDSFFKGARQATVRETALFAEGSYQVTPAWIARLGVRAFRVNQGFAQQGDGFFNGGPSAITGTSRDQGYNPKFNLSWQATPDAILYATVSKGYRPGGPNNPAPAALCAKEVATLGLSESALRTFSPDTLWNYEAGAKTQWLNKRLTLNGSLYSIDWSKVQQQIVLQCGFNITANFGSARSKGGELEAAFQATRALTLRATAGYVSAVLNNDVPGTGAKQGDTLLDVPRWSGSVAAEYNWTLGANYAGFGRLDATYTGSANALYDRSSPFYRHAGFAQVNLKLGWQPIGKNPRWTATVFVDNLLDKIGQTGLPVALFADLPDTRRIAVNRPRTMGLKLGTTF